MLAGVLRKLDLFSELKADGRKGSTEEANQAAKEVSGPTDTGGT
jgi:hypothetical protein